VIAPALVTLAIGAVLGYLAQRSRMCFIGGLRDYLLVRDAELLKGAAAFFVTAWLAFSVAGAFGLIEGVQPLARTAQAADLTAESARPVTVAPAANAARPGALTIRLAGVNWRVWALTLGAGIALGLFSTLANGCPTRQHVLAAQGIQDARYYLAGFYLGILAFYLLTKPLLALIM
jgi:uncharacterized membrane protein YedE/YeeE